jgi:hypothetical protein
LLPYFITFCDMMLTMGSKGSTLNDCPLPPGSRVAGYFRDSGGEEQERSVDQQRRVAEEYCQQHHLVLVRIFADEARPGSTIVGRDGFDDLIRYCRQYAPSAERRTPDAPEGILLWDLKRFARDRLDNAFFKADTRRPPTSGAGATPSSFSRTTSPRAASATSTRGCWSGRQSQQCLQVRRGKQSCQHWRRTGSGAMDLLELVV